MKSAERGTSCSVAVTLMREEAAGRVSDLGTRWDSVIQRRELEHPKKWGGVELGGGCLGKQSGLRRKRILQLRPGGRLL